MTEEFFLSEKIKGALKTNESERFFFWEEDVREFIRIVKEDIENAQEDSGNLDWISKDQAIAIIDKLAGDLK